MKKKMIALTVTAAVALPVHAQSSITLYGVIDEGINYTNNAGDKSAYQLESGYAQGSRWGLKGSEDLGSGLKAIFDLENGFDVNSGALGEGGECGIAGIPVAPHAPHLDELVIMERPGGLLGHRLCEPFLAEEDHGVQGVRETA